MQSWTLAPFVFIIITTEEFCSFDRTNILSRQTTPNHHTTTRTVDHHHLSAPIVPASLTATVCKFSCRLSPVSVLRLVASMTLLQAPSETSSPLPQQEGTPPPRPTSNHFHPTCSCHSPDTLRPVVIYQCSLTLTAASSDSSPLSYRTLLPSQIPDTSLVPSLSVTPRPPYH